MHLWPLKRRGRGEERGGKRNWGRGRQAGPVTKLLPQFAQRTKNGNEGEGAEDRWELGRARRRRNDKQEGNSINDLRLLSIPYDHTWSIW